MNERTKQIGIINITWWRSKVSLVQFSPLEVTKKTYIVGLAGFLNIIEKCQSGWSERSKKRFVTEHL